MESRGRIKQTLGILGICCIAWLFMSTFLDYKLQHKTENTEIDKRAVDDQTQSLTSIMDIMPSETVMLTAETDTIQTSLSEVSVAPSNQQAEVGTSSHLYTSSISAEMSMVTTTSLFISVDVSQSLENTCSDTSCFPSASQVFMSMPAGPLSTSSYISSVVPTKYYESLVPSTTVVNGQEKTSSLYPSLPSPEMLAKGATATENTGSTASLTDDLSTSALILLSHLSSYYLSDEESMSSPNDLTMFTSTATETEIVTEATVSINTISSNTHALSMQSSTILADLVMETSLMLNTDMLAPTSVYESLTASVSTVVEESSSTDIVDGEASKTTSAPESNTMVKDATTALETSTLITSSSMVANFIDPSSTLQNTITLATSLENTLAPTTIMHTTSYLTATQALATATNTVNADPSSSMETSELFAQLTSTVSPEFTETADHSSSIEPTSSDIAASPTTTIGSDSSDTVQQQTTQSNPTTKDPTAQSNPTTNDPTTNDPTTQSNPTTNDPTTQTNPTTNDPPGGEGNIPTEGGGAPAQPGNGANNAQGGDQNNDDDSDALDEGGTIAIGIIIPIIIIVAIIVGACWYTRRRMSPRKYKTFFAEGVQYHSYKNNAYKDDELELGGIPRQTLD